METKSEPQTSGMADFILDKQTTKRLKNANVFLTYGENVYREMENAKSGRNMSRPLTNL